MKKILSLLFMLFSFQYLCLAQKQGQEKIDSLLTVLSTVKADTSKINTLDAVCMEKRNISEFAEARKYADEALALSKKIDFKKGTAYSYWIIGLLYYYLSDFQQALDYNQRALMVYKEIGDKLGISEAYMNTGTVYLGQGNYPEALRNCLVALKIKEEIGDKKGAAGLFHNIASIYVRTGDNKIALNYYLKASKANSASGNKIWLSYNLLGIGYINNLMGNYPEAIKNYLEALTIQEKMGDKNGMTGSLSSLGWINTGQGKYSEALKNYFAGLKISEEIGDKDGIANSFNNIGQVYQRQGNLKEALKYETKGLSLALEVEDKEMVKESYQNLAVIDSAMGNFKGAYENHKLYTQIKDSVFNMEKDKKLTSLQMQYDFDKKESLTKAEQEKKDAIALKEVQKQKLVRNGFMGGFAVVLLFAGVFFTQRNKISKGKKHSDELLLNILPSEVAEELKLNGSAAAKQFDDVTVMFTDFKNFTQISEKLSPTELVAEIHTCFKAFDNIITKHNIEKIKTIGDSYMCAGGLPVANNTNATDVVNAALEIQQFMQQHYQQRKNEGKERFEIRIGVHTGPVVAGIVGVKKFAYDIWGDTVNIASRMESSGEAGKVNISGSTYELVKDKFNCVHRGKIEAKNKGQIDMYFVNRSLSGG